MGKRKGTLTRTWEISGVGFEKEGKGKNGRRVKDERTSSRQEKHIGLGGEKKICHGGEELPGGGDRRVINWAPGKSR